MILKMEQLQFMKTRLLAGEDIFKNKSPISFVNYKQACFLRHRQLMREKGGHGGNSKYDLLETKHSNCFICQIQCC